jgi:hypothetical protein
MLISFTDSTGMTTYNNDVRPVKTGYCIAADFVGKPKGIKIVDWLDKR